MNDVKNTIVDKCLSSAREALQNRWTFHNANEALFWFHYALRIDNNNAEARLGAARAFQYIASQPWWHNDVEFAKSAATRALAVVERINGSALPFAARQRELIKGQLYSLIGQAHLAEKCFCEVLSCDPQSSVANYFQHFNRIFINPKEEAILSGLSRAIELAEEEGRPRPLAAALYFIGFSHTLFGHYERAIDCLKRSMKLNPGYGAANLALIAATALSRRGDTYKAVRSFKERHAKFDSKIIDYLWVDRSACAEYQRLIKPMVEVVKSKLAVDIDRH